MVDQRLSKSFEALGLLIGASIVNYILIILMQRIPDTDITSNKKCQSDTDIASNKKCQSDTDIASNKKQPSDTGKISDSTRRSIVFGIGILYNAFSLFGLRSFLLPFGLIPLGLSFYMFRCFSILGDVYLKKVKNVTSFLDVALYIAFFPQVGMGPINQFSAFSRQLKVDKEFDLNRITCGMKRVIIGSFKKIVIADGLGTFVNTCFDYPANERTVFLAWMGGICFLLQEYNDFSGYSDVSIGTGLIFGYTSDENFNYPFASKSISEFWQRWHISLGAWLKTYIYVPLVIKFIKVKNPLTGKKLSPLAGDMLALFVTWFVCGAWHGRGPKYILWGMYFFVFLAAEHIVMFKNKEKAKARARQERQNHSLTAAGTGQQNHATAESGSKNHAAAGTGQQDQIQTGSDQQSRIASKSGRRLPGLRRFAGHVYALLAILMGETLFRASTLQDFGAYFKNMIGVGSTTLINHYNVMEFRNYEILFLLSILMAFPIIEKLGSVRFVKEHEVIREVASDLFLLGLLCVDIAFAFIGTYSAFIYNQF